MFHDYAFVYSHYNNLTLKAYEINVVINITTFIHTIISEHVALR